MIYGDAIEGRNQRWFAFKRKADALRSFEANGGRFATEPEAEKNNDHQYSNKAHGNADACEQYQ